VQGPFGSRKSGSYGALRKRSSIFNVVTPKFANHDKPISEITSSR
jgi:hypothetical protein